MNAYPAQSLDLENNPDSAIDFLASRCLPGPLVGPEYRSVRQIVRKELWPARFLGEIAASVTLGHC